MDYEKMLDKARDEMPESVFESERFEIPRVTGHIQGNKTILSNFNTIANTLNRPPEHILKYLFKELATPGTYRNNVLILGTKVPAARINEKIRKYATEFVLCPDCGKPDTKIMKEGEITYLRCQACGSKHTVKSIKA
ncbi:TPA: translation initiation factor IF-2 subunit beta [Candidatus Woesearchaeota archaeon]|nr:translation initiation factor IF-2 subunit beta [Candidatus Woesearchaeota archaeon]